MCFSRARKVLPNPMRFPILSICSLLMSKRSFQEDSRKMNHRLVIVVLAAVGFGAASSRAQATLEKSPVSTDQSNPTMEAPENKDPCGGHLDSAGKSECFEHRSLSIGTLIDPLFMAVPEMANPPAGYPTRWRKGPEAFGRLYGDALALQTVQQTSRFLTGLALHEDLRYFPSASRNPVRRALHAITFAAFDRSDSGRTTLALSNFLGAAAGGFVGNAYLPRGYDDTSHAVPRIGIQLGFFVAENLVDEFRPELRHLQRTLHLRGRRDAAGTRGD